MKDKFVVEALKVGLSTETTNSVVCENGEIYVSLADGSKAKISTKLVG